MIRALLLIALLWPASQLMAEAVSNERRAKFNYQMFCQGCHTQDGMGGRGVPQLKGFMGHFLSSQVGREYLVRVPGSANSVLDDEQLAEVLNWMLLNFAEDSLQASFQPYQASEVAGYRQQPLMEVLAYRKALVAALMKQEGLALSSP
ncbi:cytochrome c [Dasania sp. GY-MA-18]|uniref:Cytochrome c n=1 Tax=Dasania phycosphaerae TaxID=2950436 RepID=A0A9J6RNE8_9GAMM|nr:MULTISPECIES: cytochrome c [Dasania]MCR8923101.1 cytochrome c [Dasania sp. GY-MA-18]MCZ0865533.1 cytochrome c [Dasania phycosphaerae]MCZ0869258.1 cytochrome c [Dasania phycosphaerae]